MSDFFVDTSFIACPQPGQEASEILSYIDDLTNLHSLNNNDCIQFYLSSQSLIELTEAGYTPPYEKSELDSYVQREDITRLFYGIIKKVSYLEDKTSVAEVLFDKCSCTPNHHLINRHDVLLKSYYRLNSILAISINTGNLDETLTLITKDINGSEKVNAKGEILDLEADGAISCKLPFKFDITLLNIDDFNELVFNIDPILLWSEKHFIDSIKLAVYQMKPEFVNNQKWPNFSLDFSFHKDFFNSVENLGFRTQDSKVEMLLRACCETILDEKLADTHAIRENEKGGAKQLIRKVDNARAWRRDIDYEFHLHYWKIGDKVEFASVVPHNDFSIPE